MTQFQICFRVKVSPYRTVWINPLPNYKVLDWSKLKSFADDKLKLSWEG